MQNDAGAMAAAGAQLSAADFISGMAADSGRRCCGGWSLGLGSRFDQLARRPEPALNSPARLSSPAWRPILQAVLRRVESRPWRQIRPLARRPEPALQLSAAASISGLAADSAGGAAAG